MTLVALTGWGQPEDRRRSMDASFDDHLVKPVDLDRLLELLRRVDNDLTDPKHGASPFAQPGAA
jgi:CheY-like chemotaxis protein